MARRSRKSRSDAAGQTTAPASPFIKRSLPFFDILDGEKIEALERQVDWLIEDVGIAFRDDPVALDLWRAEGANLDGDIIRAPADWIRSLCAKAPSKFTQIARSFRHELQSYRAHLVRSHWFPTASANSRHGDADHTQGLLRGI